MGLSVYLTSKPCPLCGKADDGFSANITHNLGAMAREARIYRQLWRPEEVGITTARQLIAPLKRAIKAMKAEPERFRKHDASNGWGVYDDFLPWLERYLEACKAMPEATVTVDR